MVSTVDSVTTRLARVVGGRRRGIATAGLGISMGVVAYLRIPHDRASAEDVEILSAMLLFGWISAYHLLAAVSLPSASPTPQWVFRLSTVTVVLLAIVLEIIEPRLALRDRPSYAIEILVIGIPFARIFASILQAATTGTGVYGSQHDEDKADELAGYEDLATSVRLAGWNQRLGARVIDLVVMAAAASAAVALAPAVGVLFALLVWPLYDVTLHAMFGATIGKRVTRLRVISADGRLPCGPLKASFRWMLLAANLPFIFLETRLTGDILWAIDPRLSVMKPVYCDSMVTSVREYDRLKALGRSQRAEQVTATIRQVRAIPGPIGRRAALWFVAFVAGALVLLALASELWN